MPLMPVCSGRHRQAGLCVFEATLVDMVSYRPARKT